MIIATAGHVDHGKSSLVKQLTGIETDRLEEEQRRGLSINLGYAYLPRDNGLPVGFIDVPGHLKFINTMIAGISGVDLALLVVAADDGVMPQTIEHLDVLALMGLQHIALVITKIDRTDSATVERVQRDALLACQQRGFEGISTHRVDNLTGYGIADLRDFCLGCTALQRDDPGISYFHMSIDRAFTIKGAGLVVTGTCVAGAVTVGETLSIEPASQKMRVRSIRAHDHVEDSAQAGQRVALNLSGALMPSDIERGDWLIGSERSFLSDRTDVEITLLDSVPFKLKHAAPVKLYIGAKRVAGRIFFLEPEVRRNGPRAASPTVAQLELDAPIACFTTQRFVLRDHAETILLGGGRILVPQGPSNRKRSEHELALLSANMPLHVGESVNRLLALGSVVCCEDIAQARNLIDPLSIAPASAEVKAFDLQGKHYLVAEQRWLNGERDVIATVEAFHKKNPTEPGIRLSALFSDLEDRWPRLLLQAILANRLLQQTLRLDEGLVSSFGYQPQISSREESLWCQLKEGLQQDGYRIPLLSNVVAASAMSAADAASAAKAAVKKGRLIALTQGRYALPSQLRFFADELNRMWEAGEEITVIAAKNRWGVGRNLAVEVLEYFDGMRFTARHGQTRSVLDAGLPERTFGS